MPPTISPWYPAPSSIGRAVWPTKRWETSSRPARTSRRNWHLNVDQPQEAWRHHQEALAIFEELNDRHGIAETLDLLGVSDYMSGNLARGTAYYERAIVLFQEFDNRQGLASSLATMTMRGATYQSDTMVAAASLEEAAREGEMALRL